MNHGPLLFARFAFPPNALGYCGPDRAGELLEYADAGIVDAGLRELESNFEGAWPYLELIAVANGIADPLDERVVEAYWIGNRLLDRVGMTALGDSVTDRFRSVAGAAFERLAAAIPAGAVPHHSFHVFGVYPWMGLLRSGIVDEPLRVLDRCRVRWGRVLETGEGTARVLSRPLVWTGTTLGLSEPRVEEVVWADHGRSLVADLRSGDAVALHWDWVCDLLPARRLSALRSVTNKMLAVTNGLLHPPAAALLG